MIFDVFDIFINGQYINYKIKELDNRFNGFFVDERKTISIVYSFSLEDVLTIKLRNEFQNFQNEDGDENLSVFSINENDETIMIGLTVDYSEADILNSGSEIIISGFKKKTEQIKIGIAISKNQSKEDSESLWFGADPEYYV